MFYEPSIKVLDITNLHLPSSLIRNNRKIKNKLEF